MRKLLALLWLLSAVVLTHAADADDARALVDQAIKAHGGAERLTKMRSQLRTFKGEIVSFGTPVPTTGDASMNLPEQWRWSFELNPGNQKIALGLAVNGAKGWRSGGGSVKELTKQEVDEMRDELYVAWLMTLVPLTEKDVALTTLPEIKIGSDAAVGVKASRKGNADVKLYFDKKSNLLTKVERRGKEAGLDITKEYFLSEPKDFDGLKLPSKHLELINGKKAAEWTITAYKFPSKVDDSVFNKP